MRVGRVILNPSVVYLWDWGGGGKGRRVNEGISVLWRRSRGGWSVSVWRWRWRFGFGSRLKASRPFIHRHAQLRISFLVAVSCVNNGKKI